MRHIVLHYGTPLAPCNLKLATVLTLLATCNLQLATVCFAQTGFASISGRVADHSGAVIQKAEVSLKNLDTGDVLTAQTNNEGIYSLPSVMPGHYIMRVQKLGFRSVDVTGLTLYTQDQVARNFSLEVGSARESVTVNANNEHMETDNPAVGLLVSRDFVEGMPLNGRSLQDLIALAPGAVSSTNGTGLYAINGQQEYSNYFTVDGVSANTAGGYNPYQQNSLTGSLPNSTVFGTTQSLASIDALQEFKIQTAGYSAEYGRNPGGQVQLTTRSGTNDIHGTLSEYFRNTVLDANSWQFNSVGISRPPEHQNDFGGTLGGPLKVPHLYNGKDRTFYFVSYEGQQLEVPTYSFTTVPTSAFRQFVASNLQPFYDSLPLPNVSGHLDNGDDCAAPLGYSFSCTGEWAGSTPPVSRLNSFGARVDQAVKKKVQFFLRYSITDSSNSTKGAGLVSSLTNNSHFWTFGATTTLSSNIVDELRINFTASGGNNPQRPAAVGAGAEPYAKDLAIPSQYSSENPDASSTLYASIPGLNSIQLPYYYSQSNKLHQWNLIDTVTLLRGSHSVKVGIDYRRLQGYTADFYPFFFYVWTSLASVQLGYADTVYVYNGKAGDPLTQNFSLFVQDHWKVGQRLTVDYGLRWEFNPVPGATNGAFPLAITTPDPATMQLAPSGTPLYKSRYRSFAPRLGFTYGLRKSPKLPVEVRGGVGIFHDTGQYGLDRAYGQYPYIDNSTLTDVTFPVSASQLTLPATTAPLVPPYPFLTLTNPLLRVPYTEDWNASLDLGLAPKNTVTISYVGNAGKEIQSQQYYGVSSNPSFSSFMILSNGGSSRYKSLQIQDQGNVGAGVQLIASYTLAHALNNIQSTYVTVLANSSDDVRQAFNAALNYAVPSAPSSGRALKTLTDGWMLANRITVQSGYPINVLQGNQQLPNGQVIPYYPNRALGIPIVLHNFSGNPGGWGLNSAAFQPVPIDPTTGVPLQIGNVPPNFVYGPNFWAWNSSVQRDFSLFERLHLTFRAEAFNVLNHPNTGAVDGNLSDGTFFGSSLGTTRQIGSPNGLYSMGFARSLQLSLKLAF